MDYQRLADLLFPDVTETPADMEAKYPPRELPEGAKVTRFAPSPTGFVHFGGLFPVMVCERLAHQSGGVFYLRIEDTDKKREVEGGVQQIVQGLRAFGINFDEGPIGEDNARHIGVNVKRVKLVILITVSVMIGICVSISGTISFVGLVMPHMTRMIVGPNHKRLLASSMFSGAIFLLLADLVARTLLSPIELSIGVVTSLVGAVAFVTIFYRTRKGR